jgi:hypothetical protein
VELRFGELDPLLDRVDSDDLLLELPDRERDVDVPLLELPDRLLALSYTERVLLLERELLAASRVRS